MKKRIIIDGDFPTETRVVLLDKNNNIENIVEFRLKQLILVAILDYILFKQNLILILSKKKTKEIVLLFKHAIGITIAQLLCLLTSRVHKHYNNEFTQKKDTK